jgi:hypothetical protein
MKAATPKTQRCAIYTRKSTEHNLDLAFNSLDAQREACEAYIKSQAHESWKLIPAHFDDGGLSGASLDRPALQSLLDEVKARKVDIIVVYKVDRLTRSLPTAPKLSVSPAPTPTVAPAPAPISPEPRTQTTATGAGDFTSDSQAGAHCPTDTDVWINTRSGVYHFAGTHNYGTTKQGTYMCEAEAKGAGDRAAENERHP